ncbi:MAG: DUF4114 domain-containing protein [Gammaproteobacteria bacterium]|nr:DUF4114 domain-containing protein [Gammaproteobacteria bacterium]
MSVKLLLIITGIPLVTTPRDQVRLIQCSTGLILLGLRRIGLLSGIFGFYLISPDKGGSTFYSDSNGYDYFKVFQNDNDSSMFKLAIEDLYGGGDKDHNDMIVHVTSVLSPPNVSTVPIPGAVWLLGSGLVGLIGIRRKIRS